MVGINRFEDFTVAASVALCAQAVTCDNPIFQQLLAYTRPTVPLSSQVVHKGEVAWPDVFFIAVFAHPAVVAVAIPKLPRVDKSMAQRAVFVFPASQDHSWQSLRLIVCRKVSGSVAFIVCSLECGPLCDFATVDDGYIFGFEVLGNRINCFELDPLPAPL